MKVAGAREEYAVNLDTDLIPASDDPAQQIRRKLDPGVRFPWDAIVPACGLQRLR